MYYTKTSYCITQKHGHNNTVLGHFPIKTTICPDILGFGQTKCPNKLCDFPDKLHKCLIKITFVQTMCQHILLFISSTDNNNNNTIGLHYIMFPFLQPTVHKCTNVFLLVLGGSKRVPDIDITRGLQCYYLYVHTYIYRCTLYVE